DLATAPVRVGLAVADAGLGMANDALGMAQRPLGEATTQARSGSGSFAHMLGIDDAVERANRLARLMDDDATLGRALAPTDGRQRCGGAVAGTRWPAGPSDVRGRTDVMVDHRGRVVVACH